MAKRGDNKAAKQRRQERERQRRQATANREPGPEAFGIKLPRHTRRSRRTRVDQGLMVWIWRRSKRISRTTFSRSGIGCPSGSYFPPPVRAVEIPKPHGGGTRILGVPTVGDRIAQTVVAGRLEQKVEPIFHPDSYGYRPGRSALDAVGTCRARCWKYDWIIDLDVQKFFDSVSWDLVVKAVAARTDLPWVLLYVRRWLAAPMQLSDGTLHDRDRGTPQGVGDLTRVSEPVFALRV